jgi:hypothetical protein
MLETVKLGTGKLRMASFESCESKTKIDMRPDGLSITINGYQSLS